MRLSERQWMLSGGLGPEWRSVVGLRGAKSLALLGEVRELLLRGAPPALASFDLPRSIDAFLRARPRARDPIALHPAFDCWLSVSRSFLEGNRPAADWEAHFPYFQSFAAAAAFLGGKSLRLRARLSREGRFHASGTRLFFEFGAPAAGAHALVEAGGGELRVRADGAGEGRRLLLPEITPTTWSDWRDPLVLQPVSVQVPARPSPEEEGRFVSTLAEAMRRIRRIDPELYAEMADFLRVLVPLENPARMGSVSSSYRNLRGALCLSHTDDVLLQEETLIHEFSHQKLNLVAEADELLLPGQGGQVFFSPLRSDARRLRGLYLGAHAFLNVNRYLLRVDSETRLKFGERDSLIRNICRRVFDVEDMLRTVAGYARLTPFGARGLLEMCREQMLHCHAIGRFPAAAVESARKEHLRRRRALALGETGFHREPRAPARLGRRRGAS